MASDLMPPVAAFCAAVDWGTSSFRLWLLDRDGAVLGERRSREGMQAAAEPGFTHVLESHLAALGAPAALPVIVCGMAGARQGWIEAPYVDAPADLSAIVRGTIRVPGIARDVRILPGVAQRAPDRRGANIVGGADVMRGEETQVMGFGGSDTLLCLPGTHSKWVRLHGRKIEGFSTFMTGEVFALLAGQSILRHSVGTGADALGEPDAFACGVEASLSAPAMILNRLFSLRADALFGQNTPDRAFARLSGLVVGLEMAGARDAHPQDRNVVLMASGPLHVLYRKALALAGFVVIEADAEEAVRRGLFAAARHSFNPAEAPAR